MAKHKYAGKTVAEILKSKRASIRDAELGTGSPSWDDILDLTWEELVGKARDRKPGFQTLKKLLGKGKYDR